MNSLSVALASFNEENNIEKCLDSVKDLADEIVIVDGSSTDKTVQIAKKYTDKILVTENPAIFHINKQIAINKCTKDWILQLDADEVVSDQLRKEIIEKVLKNGNKDKNSVNGYWVPRKNWFLGRFLLKGGQFPDYTLRFYKKGKGNLPQKSVHEQAQVEGKVDYLKYPLLHYPNRDFFSYLQKWDRYNNLLSEEIRTQLKGRSKMLKFLYGLGYFILKPFYWFIYTYFRHKGFMDGWQGFIFSFFSALRFAAGYVKYLRIQKI